MFVWPCQKLDIFSELHGAKYFLPSISELDIITPSMTTWFLKPPSHHPSENMNTWTFLSDWLKCQCTFRNSCKKYWRTCLFAIAFLDDIIMNSKTAEEHLDHLQQVSTKLCSEKLSMKYCKCNFFAKEIQYVCHVISTKGIKPLSSKQKQLNSCEHQRIPNRYDLSLA